MPNWDIPPKVENKAAFEQYRNRIEIAQRFIESLGQEYVNSGSYVDKLTGIELPEGRKVTVKLGLRSLKNHPEDLFRVYLQDELGSEEKIEWESLSKGDQYNILRAAYPSGDISNILGE